MPPSKPSASKRAAQVRAARVKKNNAVVVAKAKALQRAGLFKSGTAKQVKAKVSTGAKGLSGHQKYLRRQVLKYWREIDASFIDENLKPLPKERTVKLVPVSEKVANQVRQQGRKIIRKGGKEYAVTTQEEHIKPTGEIVRRGKNYTARFIKIRPGDLADYGERQESPIYRRMVKEFAKQERSKQPQRLSFYYKANQANLHTLLTFSNADDMYQKLLEYRNKIYKAGEENDGGEDDDEIDSIAILTYAKTNELAKQTGAQIVRKHRAPQHRPPRAELPERQREHLRNMERIRRARAKTRKE